MTDYIASVPTELNFLKTADELVSKYERLLKFTQWCQQSSSSEVKAMATLVLEEMEK